MMHSQRNLVRQDIVVIRVDSTQKNLNERNCDSNVSIMNRSHSNTNLIDNNDDMNIICEDHWRQQQDIVSERNLNEEINSVHSDSTSIDEQYVKQLNVSNTNVDKNDNAFLHARNENRSKSNFIVVNKTVQNNEQSSKQLNNLSCTDVDKISVLLSTRYDTRNKPNFIVIGSNAQGVKNNVVSLSSTDENVTFSEIDDESNENDGEDIVLFDEEPNNVQEQNDEERKSYRTFAVMNKEIGNDLDILTKDMNIINNRMRPSVRSIDNRTKKNINVLNDKEVNVNRKGFQNNEKMGKNDFFNEFIATTEMMKFVRRKDEHGLFRKHAREHIDDEINKVDTRVDKDVDANGNNFSGEVIVKRNELTDELKQFRATKMFSKMIRVVGEQNDLDDDVDELEQQLGTVGSVGEEHSSDEKRKFECTICLRRFAQKQTLVQHIVTHTGQRLFPCSLCDKSFTQKGSLLRHMKIHADIRDNVCPLCSFSFRQKVHLTRHLHLHSGTAALFTCSICGRQFKRKQALERHCLIHEIKRKFKCYKCKRNFGDERELQRHYNDCNPDLCTIETDSFLRGKNTQCNSYEKTYGTNLKLKCYKCKEKFDDEVELKIHLDFLHEKSDNCSEYETFVINDSDFLLKADREVQHTSDDVYSYKIDGMVFEKFECHYCDCTFESRDELRGHLKTHERRCKVKEEIDAIDFHIDEISFDRSEDGDERKDVINEFENDNVEIDEQACETNEFENYNEKGYFENEYSSVDDVEFRDKNGVNNNFDKHVEDTDGSSEAYPFAERKFADELFVSDIVNKEIVAREIMEKSKCELTSLSNRSEANYEKIIEDELIVRDILIQSMNQESIVEKSELDLVMKTKNINERLLIGVHDSNDDETIPRKFEIDQLRRTNQETIVENGAEFDLDVMKLKADNKGFSANFNSIDDSCNDFFLKHNIVDKQNVQTKKLHCLDSVSFDEQSLIKRRFELKMDKVKGARFFQIDDIGNREDFVHDENWKDTTEFKDQRKVELKNTLDGDEVNIEKLDNIVNRITRNYDHKEEEEEVDDNLEELSELEEETDGQEKEDWNDRLNEILKNEEDVADIVRKKWNNNDEENTDDPIRSEEEVNVASSEELNELKDIESYQRVKKINFRKQTENIVTVRSNENETKVGKHVNNGGIPELVEIIINDIADTEILLDESAVGMCETQNHQPENLGDINEKIIKNDCMNANEIKEYEKTTDDILNTIEVYGNKRKGKNELSNLDEVNKNKRSTNNELLNANEKKRTRNDELVNTNELIENKKKRSTNDELMNTNELIENKKRRSTNDELLNANEKKRTTNDKLVNTNEPIRKNAIVTMDGNDNVANDAYIHKRTGCAYFCYVCKSPFRTSKHLLRHFANAHTNKTQSSSAQQTTTCSLCATKCHDVSTLRKHLALHLPHAFHCSMCDKTFNRKDALASHELIHSSRKLYKCDQCDDLEYFQKQSLRAHVLAKHTAKKSFVCDICAKGFSIKPLLTRHYLVHTNERKFACEFCDLRFKQKNHLNNHLLRHDEVAQERRPTFTCERCAKQFHRKCHYEVHMRKHDENRPLYACVECKKMFKNERTAKRHPESMCGRRRIETRTGEKEKEKN